MKIRHIYYERPGEDFIKKPHHLTNILDIPLSTPLARLFAKMNANPNHITLASIPFAGVSAYCFASNRLILGAIFFYLNVVFDNIDGKVARLTGKTSKFGEKLDYYTDTINNFLMYFGIWYGLYYLTGEWLIGIFIIFCHYAVMIFGYLFIGTFEYKTRFKSIFSYYSPFEEAYITLLFAPLFNIVEIAMPISIVLQFLSYCILTSRKGRKNIKNIKSRFKNMVKIG